VEDLQGAFVGVDWVSGEGEGGKDCGGRKGMDVPWLFWVLDAMCNRGTVMVIYRVRKGKSRFHWEGKANWEPGWEWAEVGREAKKHWLGLGSKLWSEPCGGVWKERVCLGEYGAGEFCCTLSRYLRREANL
jgi:hypothetical protein